MSDEIAIPTKDTPSERRMNGVNGLAILLGAIAATLVSVTVLVWWSVQFFSGIGTGTVKSSTPNYVNNWLFVVGVVLLIAAVLAFRSLVILRPNEGAVCQFLGEYRGTVRKDGIRAVNPFWSRVKIDLRVTSFTTSTLKVNDATGNPVVAAATVAWRIVDTAKATYAIGALGKFIGVQSTAALRQLIHSYAYDSFEQESDTETNGTSATARVPEITLVGNTIEVSESLRDALTERLALAGVEVVDARIADLAYAPEIADVMLRRQQAAALLAARTLIVRGAVNIVDDAISHLEEKGSFTSHDPDTKSRLVGNLLTVLVSDTHAAPVVNVGN